MSPSRRDHFAAMPIVAFTLETQLHIVAMDAGVKVPTAKQQQSQKWMSAWLLKAEVAYRFRRADAMIEASKKAKSPNG